MKPQRSLIIGLTTAAMALGALLVLSNSGGHSSRRQRLADGSFLQIASISYGTRHSFTIPQRKRWKTFLVTHLPPAWTARLGWWADNGSVGSSSETGFADLAVFTICDMATPTFLQLTGADAVRRAGHQTRFRSGRGHRCRL